MEAEICGEKRKPVGEELGSDSEIGGVVLDQEWVVGSSSEVVVHGWRVESTWRIDLQRKMENEEAELVYSVDSSDDAKKRERERERF